MFPATPDTPFTPTLRLDATRPLGEIVAALNSWQPEALVAYASMAYFLAAEQAEGALSIHPRAVFTSSEVLTAQMRERLVEIWGNVVFDDYASTETASIAAEDVHHHGLHLFEDLLIVENVDAQNQPVPPGTGPARGPSTRPAGTRPTPPCPSCRRSRPNPPCRPPRNRPPA